MDELVFNLNYFVYNTSYIDSTRRNVVDPDLLVQVGKEESNIALGCDPAYESHPHWTIVTCR